MEKIISLKMLIAYFLIVYCIQDSALAQQNKIEALQTKVEKLQQKVSQLESKVERLEKLVLSKKSTGESFQRNVNSDNWENKQNWRRLKRRMSRKEVRQILGEPERINASGYLEIWSYPAGGDVEFGDGEVRGWTEPVNYYQRIQSGTGNEQKEVTVPPKTEQEKSAPYELQWEGDIERSPMVQPLPDNTTDSEATITIRFEVKPNGTMGRIIPLGKMNPELEREVMRTLRKWRFSRLPSGVPQESHWGTVTFRFIKE